MSVNVQILPTPNPDALKFSVGEALVPGGSFQFLSAREAEQSPLASRLFAVQGVEAVMVSRTFATVTKASDMDWPVLLPGIKEAFVQFLSSGDVAVEGADAAPVELGDVEQRVAQAIEDVIRPALEADGGYIEFVGMEDGVVKVRLGGACGSCPHASATLAFGVQRYLVEQVPEVRGVERVD